MTNLSPCTLDLPPVRDYAPYQPGPFRVALDLHSLAWPDWIEVDCLLPKELEETRYLLATRHHEVFAAFPEAESGSQETLDLLSQHLLEYFPQIYQEAAGYLSNRATGEEWFLLNPTLHPLDLAGRLIQEDLCLMGYNQAGDRYHLTAASLCFPSRWRLLEKMGQSLGDIHGPVSKYDTILRPMDRLFAHLKVDRPVWRLNWSVLDDPTLFQPTGHGQTEILRAIKPEEAGERLWLRMERQTLRRLPISQDILFTIRVYVQPLSHLNVE